MSTCPEKDLQSLYLDNEIPEPYRSRFEHHLSECAKCNMQMEKLKKLQNALKSDAQSIVFSETKISEGYERLKARMSYSSVNNVHKQFGNVFINRVLPAMAAAMVLAVLLPIRIIMGVNSTNSNTPQPVIATVPQMLNKGVVVDENVPHATLASMFKNISSNQSTSQSRIASNATGSNVYNINQSNSLIAQSLATIDIFRPDFPESTIRINIKLSGTSQVGDFAQQNILIPVAFTAGNR